MKAFKYIPTFFYLLILYNILVFSGSKEAVVIMNQNLHDPVTMMSGGTLEIKIGDAFIMLGLIALYIEILKATRTSLSSAIDHGVSMLVFVIFLVEFIVVKPAGTSAFLILTLLALLDVIGGFTVTISSARRDIGVIRE